MIKKAKIIATALATTGLISLPVAMGIKLPLNTFFSAFGLLGSVIYYISSGICAVLVFFTLYNINYKDIYFIYPSIIKIIVVGFFGIIIAYLSLNLFSGFYSHIFFCLSLSLTNVKPISLIEVISLAKRCIYPQPLIIGSSDPSGIHFTEYNSTTGNKNLPGSSSITPANVSASTHTAPSDGSATTSSAPHDRLSADDAYYVPYAGSAQTLGRDFVPLTSRHTGVGGIFKAGKWNGAMFIVNTAGEKNYDSNGSHEFASSMADAIEHQMDKLKVKYLTYTMLSAEDKTYLADYLQDKYPNHNYTGTLSENSWGKHKVKMSTLVELLRQEKK